MGCDDRVVKVVCYGTGVGPLLQTYAKGSLEQA